MDYRIFKLNNETCIIHYPEKPNGFGVLLIGNDDQYVNEGGSSWLRNNNRLKVLRDLIDKGYTIFYSNLGGKHMGNQYAAEQAKNLYEYVKRTEILNEKIHIVSEGVGAMVVNDFLQDKPNSIRSCLLINPIFSLKWLHDMMKDQPFFYKRFLQEVANAYKIDVKKCEKIIINSGKESFTLPCPYKIVHILEHGVKDGEWIKLYKVSLDLTEGALHVILPEKTTIITNYATKLFTLTENPL